MSPFLVSVVVRGAVEKLWCYAVSSEAASCPICAEELRGECVRIPSRRKWQEGCLALITASVSPICKSTARCSGGLDLLRKYRADAGVLYATIREEHVRPEPANLPPANHEVQVSDNRDDIRAMPGMQVAHQHLMMFQGSSKGLRRQVIADLTLPPDPDTM